MSLILWGLLVKVVMLDGHAYIWSPTCAAGKHSDPSLVTDQLPLIPSGSTLFPVLGTSRWLEEAVCDSELTLALRPQAIAISILSISSPRHIFSAPPISLYLVADTISHLNFPKLPFTQCTLLAVSTVSSNLSLNTMRYLLHLSRPKPVPKWQFT